MLFVVQKLVISTSIQVGMRGKFISKKMVGLVLALVKLSVVMLMCFE